MLRFAPILLLLLSACAPPSGGQDPFTRAPGPDDELIDEQDSADAGDPELLDDPDEDADVEPDALSWEPLPGEAPVGAIWVGVFNCGMLSDEAEVWMERTEDGWQQSGRLSDHPAVDEIDETHGMPLGDVGELCFDRAEPDRSVIWEEDGSFHFFNGHWDHHLRPLGQEGRWLGGVAPMFNISEACRDELDSLGLSLPATISLTHVGTWW